jgi:hypothetical protein
MRKASQLCGHSCVISQLFDSAMLKLPVVGLYQRVRYASTFVDPNSERASRIRSCSAHNHARFRAIRAKLSTMLFARDSAACKHFMANRLGMSVAVFLGASCFFLSRSARRKAVQDQVAPFHLISTERCTGIAASVLMIISVAPTLSADCKQFSMSTHAVSVRTSPPLLRQKKHRSKHL